MENYDYVINTSDPIEAIAQDTLDDIPEPMDQWSIEDFEQFASFIVEAE